LAEEGFCGDGALDSATEQCDDGNHINRDGCSSYCKIEDMTPPTVTSVSIPDGTK
jgi:cysteine-rich repeat protein